MANFGTSSLNSGSSKFINISKDGVYNIRLLSDTFETLQKFWLKGGDGKLKSLNADAGGRLAQLAKNGGCEAPTIKGAILAYNEETQQVGILEFGSQIEKQIVAILNNKRLGVTAPSMMSLTITTSAANKAQKYSVQLAEKHATALDTSEMEMPDFAAHCEPSSDALLDALGVPTLRAQPKAPTQKPAPAPTKKANALAHDTDFEF